MAIFISLFFNPISALAASLPSFLDFSKSVQNGDANVLRGVYASNVMALPVVQQPSGNAGYVSNNQGEITQFRMATQFGNMIPGGLRFLQPETAWRPRRFSSFDSVCDQLIEHRKANPYLIHKNGHTIERSQVENEVDNFNTRVCQQMGWLHFIQGGEALPVPFLVRRSEHKPLPPQPGFVQSLQNVAAGSEAIAAIR